MLHRVRFTPSLDTAQYGSGDVLFNGEVVGGLPYGRTGWIRYFKMTDKSDQKAVIAFFILKSNTALGTRNSAPNISDDNADEIISHFHVAAADYEDLGGVSVAVLQADSVPYDLGIPVEAGTDGSTSFWLSAIVTGTPTYAAAGLVIDFFIEVED